MHWPPSFVKAALIRLRPNRRRDPELAARPIPFLPLVREAEVVAWAKTASHTSVLIDPSREVILDSQRNADVLVLLSQPFTNWKEQIGLPIVEGLSVGTEIVASSETGIAGWLVDHGHQVLAPDASRTELADAITGALRSRRPRSAVLDDLPEVDGRLAADRWLFASTTAAPTRAKGPTA